METIKQFAKKIAFKYLRLGIPRYGFNVEPIQLALLINEIERLKDVDGCICEIGVARGVTTRFLAQHIHVQGIENKNKYYAFDTFNSFKKSDLEYEVNNRGKRSIDLKGFEANSFNIWKKNFSKFQFIEAIQADCSKFDFSKLEPIKITFLDVDLYLSTKSTLNNIYDATIKGGVIIVDDVMNNSPYDGAFQAYTEFCEAKKIKPVIVGNKCGVIYKD